MGFALRQGVTFCQTGGYTFFLDVVGDRYLAIGGDAAAAFQHLVASGQLDDAQGAALSDLVRSGLLRRTDRDERPTACAYVPTTSDSAVDLAEQQALRPGMLNALRLTITVKLALEIRGLAACLAKLERRKRDAIRATDTRLGVAQVAAAFERCNQLFNPLDQCLPRSIAVAHCLLDRGFDPIFVMGVRAQPFSAHAWVECSGLIANDRFDNIDPFKPILVL